MREALEKSKGTIDGPLSHKLITQRISTSRHCGIPKTNQREAFQEQLDTKTYINVSLDGDDQKEINYSFVNFNSMPRPVGRWRLKPRCHTVNRQKSRRNVEL